MAVRAPNLEDSYLYDNIVCRVMTDAESLYPCGHTFCAETIANLRRTGSRCPLDRKRFTNSVPNFTVRRLAEEALAAAHGRVTTPASPTSTSSVTEQVSSPAERDVSSNGDEGFPGERERLARLAGDPRNNIVFLEAAENGRIDELNRFLDQGVAIDGENPENWTALMFAASRGHLEAVNLLLERRANANAKDTFSTTALHWAARGGHTEILSALLDHGAIIDAPDFEGRTSLMLTARAGHLESVRCLLARGADVKAKNSNGDTSLSLAKKNHHAEIEQFLRRHGADQCIVS